MSSAATTFWQTLYDAISKTYPNYRYVRKPSIQDLDEFEASTGCPLPRSYREFIEVFGPSELGQRFRIHAPGYARPNHEWDLRQFVQDYRGWKQDFFATYKADQDARLAWIPTVPFATKDLPLWAVWGRSPLGDRFTP
jgi:hypothetical protein